MKKRFINFKVDQVIQANLEMPSVQKTLKDDFKIFNFCYSTIKSDKFLNLYKNWPTSKKDYFCRTIGGKVFSRKVQSLLESIYKNGEQYERAL